MKSTKPAASFQPIGLGDRVVDRVTGFNGIVVCITTWLNGCVRYGLQAEELTDGKPLDPQYFDAEQVALQQSQAFVCRRQLFKDAPVVAPPGGAAREGAGFRPSAPK